MTGVTTQKDNCFCTKCGYMLVEQYGATTATSFKYWCMNCQEYPTKTTTIKIIRADDRTWTLSKGGTP